MNIFPNDKYQIETVNSPDQVFNNLSKNVGAQNIFGFNALSEYIGSISKSEFKIYKNISYLNSFNPIIVGKIEPSKSGTVISITFRLHKFVMCFMSFWFFGVGFACLMVLTTDINDLNIFLSIPFIMLFFGVYIVYRGFWGSVSKQKEWLHKVITKN